MANQHVSLWTPAAIETAKRVLATCVSVREAALVLAAHLGREVTAKSIQCAFQRFGLPPPSTFLFVNAVDAPQPSGPPPSLPAFDIREPSPDLHPIERADLKRDESRLRSEHKRMVEELRVANERASFYERISRHPSPPHVPRREKTSGLRDCTAVVLASDWHVEEEVDPETIAGRNEYNLEIAARRIDRFFDAIAWNIEHHRSSRHLTVRDLVLWLGGDLMSGYIHEELMEGNQLSPVETCLWLQPRLRGGIKMLLDQLDLASLVIPCSYGNHGRTTPKRRVATGAENSYEWGMYHNLASHFEDDSRVRFEITRSGHQYVSVYDFKLHFHHGDDVQFQGGVGGIGIPLNKAVDAWNDDIRCDIHNIGHWHQLKTFGAANVNGSLIGFNAYAKSIKARFEEPRQAFYLVDANRGQSMWTPLWVGEMAQRRAA